MKCKKGFIFGVVLLALSACGRGPTGYSGIDGKDGSNGTNGSNGSNGANGTDATPVTIVKLCPGVTTYPSTFVEVAIKVGGKLYAVYSLNNGFLTELVPGHYSSNAVGSACNFTVNADLTIAN